MCCLKVSKIDEAIQFPEIWRKDKAQHDRSYQINCQGQIGESLILLFFTLPAKEHNISFFTTEMTVLVILCRKQISKPIFYRKQNQYFV